MINPLDATLEALQNIQDAEIDKNQKKVHDIENPTRLRVSQNILESASSLPNGVPLHQY